MLDASLARHLFGLEVEPRLNARTGELDYVCRRPGQVWQRVSSYSSANAIMALAVEFKLSDFGWKLSLASEARWNATGSVRVVLERAGTQVVGIAATFEEALCVAALRAVGQSAEVRRLDVAAWRAGQRYAAERYRALYGKYFSKHN